MPLGDDQKAMLRLLARDQSYADIAALMGLSLDEVVSRAQDAVAQLEAEGIPAPALPEAPAGPAPAADQPRPPEPKAEPPAPRVEPPAQVEKPAAPPPQPAKEAAVKATPPPSPASAAKPRDANKLLAIGGGVAAVIVIVVLVVLLVSGGDGGDDSTTAGSGENTTVAEDGGATSREPTTAQLEAVDGSEASGSAEFGRVDESLALGVKATGVEALPKGQIYMVWLAATPQEMLPLTALRANKAGRINASYQVPTEAVVYLASGDFDRLVITRTENAALRKSLERANQDKEFPTYTGDPVLEGQIVGPIVGAAKRLEEQQERQK